jgi:hypothetical protein
VLMGVNVKNCRGKYSLGQLSRILRRTYFKLAIRYRVDISELQARKSLNDPKSPLRTSIPPFKYPVKVRNCFNCSLLAFSLCSRVSLRDSLRDVRRRIAIRFKVVGDSFLVVWVEIAVGG